MDMDISWGSDAWFPVCHRASKEWSAYLLFQACSTSVSGQIDLTEAYTLQLQLHPSFVMHHYTSGSGLSFCAKELTRSGTLPRAPPRSPHPAMAMAWSQTMRPFPVPGKTISCWSSLCPSNQPLLPPPKERCRPDGRLLWHSLVYGLLSGLCWRL